MKVVHFNTFEGGGGAAKASLVLHQEILRYGVDASLIVYKKVSKDTTVIDSDSLQSGLAKKKIFPYLLSVIHRIFFKPLEIWSFGVLGTSSIVNNKKVNEADIIGLSWVSWFLDIDDIASLLKKDKPVIWTCYDMWAFTGGCHYSGECDNYINDCTKCPQIGRGLGLIPEGILKRKERNWDTSMLTIVCPSQWLAKCVKSSALMGNVRVEVIPTGIDTSVYKPMSKVEARNYLDLPIDKKLILFIATGGLANERKGGKELTKSLSKLLGMFDGCMPDLVILGRRQTNILVSDKVFIHTFEFHDDVSLAYLYAACDVLVAPSKFDNLPLTVLQAMASGTPCVAYDIGGMKDAILHTKNGYLAKPFDEEDFANGISYILSNKGAYNDLSLKCVERISEVFDARQEARKYIELYESILK